MKRKTIINTIVITTATSFLVLAGVAAVRKIQEEKPSSVFAASIPTTNIDLNDCTESEIRNYYSSLDDLSSNELQGTNLLKNLKTILKNMTYYSYDDCWQMYEITDRDWVLSPAASDSSHGVTYDSSTNKFTSYTYGTGNDSGGSNPYVRTLYRDHTYNSARTGYVNGGEIQEWGDHGNTGTNREHVWCQSRGFKASSGAKGPAGTDIHHLKSGDGYVNQSVHNNHPYGYVNTNASYTKGNQTYTNKNYYGTSATLGSGKVFEPQDEEKGDIARACFYMCARYNNYAGTSGAISSYEPFLALENVVTGEETATSSDTTPATIGILQDLLQWHKEDPVDEFEIHRNNLIFRNYQFNRNPFIDYPEWVDYIWGTVSNGVYYPASTGSASPASDTINGYGSATAPTAISLDTNSATIGIGGTKKINISSVTPSNAYNGVSWESSNTAVATVSSNGLVTGVAAGTVTITATSKLDSTVKATATITVQDIPVTSISLDKSTLSMKSGGHDSLSVSYEPENATTPTITWTSSNEAIVKVSAVGGLTAYSEGTATITASDGKGHTATCTVTVSGVAVELSETTYELVGSDEDLDVTRKIAIVALDYSKALSTTQNTNNRAATAIVKTTSDSTITMTDSTAAIRLDDGNSSGQYGLHVTNGDTTGYLYAASSSSNYLKTEAELDANGNGSFSISINSETAAASIVANGTYSNATMRYNNTSSLFSCYAGSSNVLDLCIYQQKAIAVSGDVDATGVTLDQTSLSITKGSSTTLTATVSPVEATNKNVTWSSSVPSVATVNSSGTITAVSVGTTIVTVTTEDGGFTANCTVTVTPASAGSNYYQKQTSTSTVVSGNYVICANVNGTYYPMPLNTTGSNALGSSTPITVANNQISETNAADYVVALTVSGTSVSIKNSDETWIGSSSNKVVSNATSAYSWTIGSGEHGTFRLSHDSTRCLAYRLSYTRFADYATSNVTSSSTDYFDLELFKYTSGSGSYTVDNFVEDFLTSVTCDATGSSEPTFKSGYSWSELETKYNSLTNAEKTELTNYVANENGNDEAKCVARYDYIVGKYGTAKYKNFLNRTIISSSNFSVLNRMGNGYLPLYIFITVMGLVTVGGFVFYRKRKHQ